MHRRALIAGNWKMHLTIKEACELAKAVVHASQNLIDRDIMIAPAATALAAVAEQIQGSNVQLGSQNVAWEKSGAFTGEISAPMLVDLGVRMALAGHSERRQLFGEDDTMVNKRVHGALSEGLIPVLCIGETLAERENGTTFSVLENQLKAGLADVPQEKAGTLVIAYEPVWAIGTGKTASTEQAQEVHAFLRAQLATLFSHDQADQIRILYGGSVKPDNVDALMAQPDIDGALVGGAALDGDSFARIIGFQ